MTNEGVLKLDEVKLLIENLENTFSTNFDN